MQRSLSSKNAAHGRWHESSNSHEENEEGGFVRTLDVRFEKLSGFPFEPSYVDSLPGYEGLRAHYLDLGPKDAKRTFLCLHGEPTWSYLYRKMIPVMLESDARVVAPDFFGFGRSDKPTQDSEYSFHFHREFLLRLVEHVAARNITLVVQDWGGTLGLTLPVDVAFRSKLERLFVMNTVLPIGKPLGPHYYEWRALVRSMPDMPVGQLVRKITPQLSDEEMAAYDAPFPDSHSKAGARTFPELAMVEPGMEGVVESVAALKFWREDWSGQSFMAIGAKAPDADTMYTLRSQIRGCPEPLVLTEADHFVPEWGEPVVRAALRHFGDL
jgi:haloalkane dehalogenase